jgi:hypothetical protein
MIDWYGLFCNAVWILGLAVVLAAMGMANFQTRIQGVKLRRALISSGFQLPFGVGMFLFCLGVFLSSQAWWERVLWGLLAVLFAGQVIWLWRNGSGEPAEDKANGSEVGHPAEPVKTTVEERGP